MNMWLCGPLTRISLLAASASTTLRVILLSSFMLSRNTVTSLRTARSARRAVRNLSARASAVLGALDIPVSTEVPGVYDGRWGGSGDILESVCPTTGEVLARVQSVRPLYPIAITSAAGLIPN